MINDFTFDTDASPENMNMIIKGINKHEEDISGLKTSVEEVGSAIGQKLDKQSTLEIIDQVPVVKTTTQTVQDKKSKQILYPYHWVYPVGSETSVGILKLRLPTTWNGTMFNMSLSGFNYIDGLSSFEILLGGYTNIGAAVWERTTASIKGESPFSKVRFAYDGQKCCILLGELDTIWKHPSLSVDLLRVYYLGVDDWESGWSAEIITSEAGLTSIVEVELQGAIPKETIITSNFTSGWSGEIKYDKTQDGKISVQVNLLKSTDYAGGGTLLYTMPAGNRPSGAEVEHIYMLNSSGSIVSNGEALCYIDSQGRLWVVTKSTTTIATARKVQCSFEYTARS